ncbi:MAG: class I SAM-dependent methyltransferase [Elusimicrobiota bacterium]
MGPAKDLFSKQAHAYARFRPTYPPELFEYLASLVAGRALAWDCGTGNGQAAVGLTPYFKRIIATDLSEKQIAQAKRHPKIDYRTAVAEDSPLLDKSADLTISAQAAHWFNLERFYGQVRRVLKPGGIIALWCYGRNRKMEQPIGDMVGRYAADIVGSFWEPEIKNYVWTEYKTLPFPFDEITAPDFQIKAEWDLAQLLGYLSSWSSGHKFADERGINPLTLIEPELRKAWKPAKRTIRVNWDIHLRVGRLP